MLSNFDVNRAMQLIHHHGGDEGYPMYEVEPAAPDAASDDPERAWHRGSRVYRCSGCHHQIAVALSSEADPRDAPDTLG